MLPGYSQVGSQSLSLGLLELQEGSSPRALGAMGKGTICASVQGFSGSDFDTLFWRPDT